MKAKVCVLAVAALAAWGMKRHYADARADDLQWVLGPTARLVEAGTGARFAFVPGEGHFSHERLFLIEKSCAGVNFMIAAFGMTVVALLHRVRGAVPAAGVLAAAIAAGYAAALFVNTTRIAAAMFTRSTGDVHRIEGITVYFAGLLLLHELVQRADRAASAAMSRR